MPFGFIVMPRPGAVQGFGFLIVPQAGLVQPGTPGTKSCGNVDKDATGPVRRNALLGRPS